MSSEHKAVLIIIKPLNHAQPSEEEGSNPFITFLSQNQRCLLSIYTFPFQYHWRIPRLHSIISAIHLSLTVATEVISTGQGL